MIKTLIVILESGGDNGVFRLIGLDENIGGIKMATADSTDDLGNKVESPLLRGKVGEGKAGVSLNNTDGGEEREIEAFGDSLGANDNVVISGFYLFKFGV